MATSGRNTGLDGSGTHDTYVDPDPVVAGPVVADPGGALADSGRNTPFLPEVGVRIGQYEIIRPLGRGGMGAVYLARDVRLGRRVAIKFLHSTKATLNARFVVEGRATARCNHENIVVIHDVGEHEATPFMVLEYLEGVPLSKLLDGGRKIPPSRAVELMVPVVRALVKAHEHNIVHRDLKPDNIFIADSGTVKVLDFGIAKLLQDRGMSGGYVPQSGDKYLSPGSSESTDASVTAPPARPGPDEGPDERTAGPPHSDDGSHDDAGPGGFVATASGVLLGTLPYMSPEQWWGKDVDHRTDLWAVGIILFTMVAGKHPLAPRQGRELMVTGFLDEPMPGVGAACPDVPDDLASVIDHCLIKPKEQRVGSARELLDALEALRAERHGRRLLGDRSPYAGLSSFQERDAHRFFGRDADIAAAVMRVRDRPLVAVAGPSGVGKSSFVRAGVIPALKRSGEPWHAIVVRPGRQPLTALAQIVASLVDATGDASTSGGAIAATMTPTVGATVAADLSEQRASAERMVSEPGYLGSVLRSRARRQGQAIVLFVDQFEELYTLGADPDERMAFTACLAGAADDATTPVRVILSIRSDFLDRVAEDRHFMAELAQGLYFLTAPDRAGLRDALIQPAEMAGYLFESPATVEHMLDHLESTAGALPLLQFAAGQLWAGRDRDRKLLTDASYRALGGVAGALAGHADAVLAGLSADDQRLVRTVLLRLITPERTRAVASPEELGELPGDPAAIERVVESLVRARLLVVQTGEGPSRVSIEIVHESLLHTWPALRRWLDENQDDAAFLDQLRTAARQWQARGFATGLVWRGEAAIDARLWHGRRQRELPELQRAYLRAVFALAARSTRVKRWAVAGVIALLSLLVAAAAVALVVIRDAQREATDQAARAEEQLERVRTEQQARARAETVADEANLQVDRKNEELERANRELRRALGRAEEDRMRAEVAGRRARAARGVAEREGRAARQAEAEALAANRQLQVLLAREKARADRLEAEGTHLVEDVVTGAAERGAEGAEETDRNEGDEDASRK